MIFVFKSFHF